MPTAKDRCPKLDPRRRAYLRMYLEVEESIFLKGEYLVRDLRRRRTAGAPIIELEASDLIQYAWRILLEREPDFAGSVEFKYFFFRRMENHCREVSKRCSEASARRVPFYAQEEREDDGQDQGDETREVAIVSLDDFRRREIIDERNSRAAHVRRRLEALAPELLPLFDLMILHRIFEARNQAAHLGTEVEVVYRLREKLKAFIRRNVDPEA